MTELRLKAAIQTPFYRIDCSMQPNPKGESGER